MVELLLALVCLIPWVLVLYVLILEDQCYRRAYYYAGTVLAALLAAVFDFLIVFARFV